MARKSRMSQICYVDVDPPETDKSSLLRQAKVRVRLTFEIYLARKRDEVKTRVNTNQENMKN